MHVRPLHDRAVVRFPFRSRRAPRTATHTVVTLTRAPDGVAIAAHCTGAPADTWSFGRRRQGTGRRAAPALTARGRPRQR
ncbi:hypothetical protein L602_002200000440 [Cupriavidus gilardii J11]|uniref:Uncharacterized protein n=1 Tax=Cupriavidus gilardii J11 TaxID=936133 RepID=A0A562BM34_9BURK|nr:hypothetical protein L602_002200000440 [Cupriavidus gilardii J11]